MNKTTRILVSLIIVVGTGLVLTSLKKPQVTPSPNPAPLSVNTATTTNPTDATTSPEDVGKVEGASVTDSGMFQHQNPNFEFKVPDGYTLGRMDNGEDGEALIVQSASGTAAQIFISQHTQNATLTPE